MAAGDRQCPRHAGCEHQRPNTQDEGSIEVPARGGKGEEANVPGGMPTAAPELLPLFRLVGLNTGGGGDGNFEKVIQLPGHQMEAILLKYVRIHQE